MKILSIDGGGMKGLFSSLVLEQIEKIYQVDILKHFNVLAGTSAGGLISLGLASGKSPSEIAYFFKTKGPQIFLPHMATSIYRKIRSFVWGAKHSGTPLETSLKEFFGEDLTLGDIYTRNQALNLNIRLCIPSVNLELGNKVFKTPHHPELSIDADYEVWKVGLATASAPVYFPIAKFESPKQLNEFHVDGGVWSNNPSLVALTEALTYGQEQTRSSFAFEDLQLLSIGNFKTHFGDTVRIRSRSLLLWNLRLIDLFFGAQTLATENTVRLLFEHGKGRYVRIEYESLSKGQAASITLDAASRKSIELIQKLSDAFCAKNLKRGTELDRELTAFFEKGD